MIALRLIPFVMSITCRFVFGVTAFLPLMTSAVAVLVKEQAVLPSRAHNLTISSSGFIESTKQHIMQLWAAVRQPDIFFPTLFIFLWQATPHSESAMFYFTYASTKFLLVAYFIQIYSLKYFNFLT